MLSRSGCGFSTYYTCSDRRVSFVADTLRMVGRKMKEREVKEDDVDLAVSDPCFHCIVCLADCAIVRWPDGRGKGEVGS